MESEERPMKMRKLSHDAEIQEAAFSDALANAGSGNEDINGDPATHLQRNIESESDELTAKIPKLPQGLNSDKEVSLAVSDTAVLKPKETELVEEQTPKNNDDLEINDTPTEGAESGDGVPKISKNQLKKQRRKEQWEAGREDRAAKRREKHKAKKERKRDEWAQNHAQEGEAVAKGAERLKPDGPKGQKYPEKFTQVPITFLFDCDFDDLMFESELKSLGVQITRSYSDNRKSPFQAHMGLTSFGGKLKERFDGILAKQYTSWKNFQFFSEDFVHVAENAKDWMKGEEGGKVAGALTPNDSEEGEVVYLSSDSDVTLERLKPNSTYIIGGLVDKNRHKGLCYKRATDRGIKTAKLPIGEFLQMRSRQVLATNHVIEIMIKWLQCGDWGQAFMEVIPKRKGGVLKSNLEQDGQYGDEGQEGDEGSAKHSEEQAQQEENVEPGSNGVEPEDALTQT